MVKRIDKIIQSKTAPNSDNVLWDDGKNLNVKRNGIWESTGESAPMINIAYENLVKLRDNKKLIPGQQYRITDYVTTTTQTDTESAGHPFDIIVTADSENTFNEVARAVLHEGDTYFAEAKLEAWQIWYCFDNDTERFGWADAENGKGVIYRMIDEFDNDCPYDFKNIKFKRWELGKPTWDEFPSAVYTLAVTMLVYYLRPETYKWAGSRMWDYPLDEEYCLTQFIKSTPTGNSKSFFTFTDKDGTTDLSLAGTSHHNTIKESTFWDGENFPIQKWLNQIVLFNDCNNNNFERNCHELTLSDFCLNNYFGERSSKITISDSKDNVFDKYTYNILLQACIGNKFLKESYDIALCASNHNTFLEGSTFIVFESSCNHNIIGESSEIVAFRSYCDYNVLEGTCRGIFLRMYCTYNKFIEGFNFESTNERFTHNTFDKCNTIRFSNGIAKYITIKPGVSNVTLVGNGTSSDEIRYIEVDGSVQGASGSPIEVTVPVNANYSNKVSKKSDGTVVVYNEADLVK